MSLTAAPNKVGWTQSLCAICAFLWLIQLLFLGLYTFSHGHLKYGPPGGITRTCG